MHLLAGMLAAVTNIVPSIFFSENHIYYTSSPSTVIPVTLFFPSWFAFMATLYKNSQLLTDCMESIWLSIIIIMLRKAQHLYRLYHEGKVST